MCTRNTSNPLHGSHREEEDAETISTLTQVLSKPVPRPRCWPRCAKHTPKSHSSGFYVPLCNLNPNLVVPGLSQGLVSTAGALEAGEAPSGGWW